MFFKQQLIKNYLKIQVINQEAGALTIRIANLSKLDDQYKGFEAEVKDLFMLLPGIQDLKTEFETGIITFYYDEQQLTARQVATWINLVIDTAISQFDFIKKNWQKSPELVKATLTHKLKEKI